MVRKLEVDVLLFTSKPEVDIPEFQSIFEEYGRFSGMKINFHKSEILPLTLQTPESITPNTQYTIAKEKIRYSGIKIGKTPSSLYNLNYPPLISKILRELELWIDFPLSLFGRAQLVNIIRFARLRYPLQALPVLLKHKDAHKLTRAMQNLICQKKTPELSSKNFIYLSLRPV